MFNRSTIGVVTQYKKQKQKVNLTKSKKINKFKDAQIVKSFAVSNQ